MTSRQISRHIIPHILLIDSDTVYLDSLSRLLKNEQFSVSTASDADEGLQSFYETEPNLVLLDPSLPKTSGEEVCRAIKSVSTTPIIFLSSKSNEIDKISGLELGADDYVVKPFSNAELVARIRTIIRGTAGRREIKSPYEDDNINTFEVAEFIQSGPVHIDLGQHSVRVNGVLTQFTLKEFALLEALISNPGRILSRGQLADAIWGDRRIENGKSIEVLIKRVRIKIEDEPNNPQIIRTVRGLGYLWEKSK